MSSTEEMGEERAAREGHAKMVDRLPTGVYQKLEKNSPSKTSQSYTNSPVLSLETQPCHVVAVAQA
jgi:hypothetical protein